MNRSVKEISFFEIKDVQQVPRSPGIYLFYDPKKRPLYVGKAKNLYKRVNSYFRPIQSLPSKVRIMVGNIASFSLILTPSENEALLLENQLIKTHQPKYNILLRDDKTFPYLCLVKEPFPRLLIRRRKTLEGEYFGPYTQVSFMKALYKLLHEVYFLRTCTYPLSFENIQEKKYKLCLEYQMKRCLGPCQGIQTEQDYEENIRQIRQILSGRWTEIKKHLNQKMEEASQKLLFEKAQIYQNMLQKIGGFHTRSLVVQAHLKHVDVFSFLNISSVETQMIVNYMQIREGAISLSDNLLVQSRLEEDNANMLQRAMIHCMEKHQSHASEIISPIPVKRFKDDLNISIPSIGDKKKLLLLSEQNAMLYRDKKMRNRKIPNLMQTMQRDLHMQETPRHIDCFDISHLQGTNTVGAMTCFKDGKPDTKSYRKFKIKGLQGQIDDVKSMKEVLHRHYIRQKKEGHDLPQLIIVDGGKGQLNAAIQVLKDLDLYGLTHVIAIAKRLEEIYVPKEPLPLELSKENPTLQQIQRIRDETHRFVIGFHRNQRSRQSFQSFLRSIKGIGPLSQKRILKSYTTRDQIKSCSLQDLSQLIGKSRALSLKESL
ncbi:MAG: excinuclease ABC subunit UvrC [Cytophagales bacterium]|nr:excinuclease ABC subunit UvrC [Cytophagales bacterium]